MINIALEMFRDTLRLSRDSIVVYSDNSGDSLSRVMTACIQRSMKPRMKASTIKVGGKDVSVEYTLVRGAQKIYFVDALSEFLIESPDSIQSAVSRYLCQNPILVVNGNRFDISGKQLFVADRAKTIDSPYQESDMSRHFLGFVDGKIGKTFLDKYAMILWKAGYKDIIGYVGFSDVAKLDPTLLPDRQPGNPEDVFILVPDGSTATMAVRVEGENLSIGMRIPGEMVTRGDLPEFNPTLVVFNKKPPFPSMHREGTILSGGTRKTIGMYISFFKHRPDFAKTGRTGIVNLFG